MYGKPGRHEHIGLAFCLGAGSKMATSNCAQFGSVGL